MPKPLYRTRQVVHALRPRIDGSDFARALELLSEAETRLFLAMQRRDQRHALEVMRRLMAAGVQDQNVLKAALLHDCGKDHVPVWLRVLNVVAPATVRTCGRPDAPGWRGAAYRLVHHAEIGAGRVREAGSDPEVAALIEGTAPSGREWALAALRAADDAS